MNSRILAFSLVAFTAAQIPSSMAKPDSLTVKRDRPDPYREAIRKTSKMVSDAGANRLAQKHGLDILNVTWEDTGRFQDSAVGPNISDMTIQVAHEKAKGKGMDITSMPVIRHPNFSDKTCDLDPRDFTLLVGNQKGEALKRISLYEFLEHPTRYLTKPGSWKAKDKTLLEDRDGKVLVSAQACFLPVPKRGKSTFNPVLFNYQSYKGDPAVLTVLATREGTSVTIIDNERDAFDDGSVWGQRLFHNAKGKRASLTGQRQSEFLADNPDAGKGVEIDDEHSKGKAEAGLNMVLLIQIPLKQKHPMEALDGLGGGGGSKSAVPLSPPPPPLESDVENAVIGHGDLEGPFTEIDDVEIERDGRFPVRVTVQFYKATSNGVVSEADMEQIAAQLDRVYAKSDYVGSLVTGGSTGRVTEYEGSKVQPAGWWDGFWARHEKNTGDTPEEAMAKLRALLGKNYRSMPVCDLYLRDVLANAE